ncbi:MAG TPA: DMT family transporter [Thermomicrobiales bacterium]|nr:DMT family transporter [Thermomicrobiales bacterium]
MSANEAPAAMAAAANAATSPTAAPWWLRAAPAIFLLLWSAGFPIGKIGLHDAAPMTFLSVRYALVLAVLLPLQAWLRPTLPRGSSLRHLIVTGLLIQGVYFGLGYAAIALGVAAGTAALIVSLQPILVAMLAPRLTGERIPGGAWLGFALGFAGAAVAIVARAGPGASTWLGMLCAAGSLLGMTAGTLYEKRHGVAAHPVPANLVQYAAALVAFLPFAWLTEGFRIMPTAPLALALAYLVIGNSLIAITLLLAMIRAGDVSRVSTLFFLVPPMAALLSWLLVGERMPPFAWLGFILAAAGVALVARARRSPARA